MDDRRLYNRKWGKPGRAFLSGLQDRDKVEAFALVQLLSERGNTLRLPHSQSLGEG
jgi:hypothetical protein